MQVKGCDKRFCNIGEYHPSCSCKNKNILNATSLKMYAWTALPFSADVVCCIPIDQNMYNSRYSMLQAQHVNSRKLDYFIKLGLFFVLDEDTTFLLNLGKLHTKRPNSLIIHQKCDQDIRIRPANSA